MSIILNMSNGESKTISNLEQSGVIVLTEFETAPNEITITPTLVFSDEILDDNKHEITYSNVSYQIKYQFEIEKLQLDYYVLNKYNASDDEEVPVHINFKYQMPDTYKIRINTDNNIIDEEIALKESYENKIIRTTSTLTIQVLDDKGNPFNEALTYNIESNDIIKPMFDDASANSPNPGDSIVTYNDDGTMNIYRYTVFTTTNPN